jgi:hypothetical protein
VLEQIARFAGIDPFPPTEAVHAFAATNAEPVRDEDRCFVRRCLADDIDLFARLSGLDVTDWRQR